MGKGDTMASIYSKFDEARRRVEKELILGIQIVSVNRKLQRVCEDE